jgi:hypothetical protein
MTTRYGNQFSGTDPNKKSDGRVHNAALRLYGNIFNLVTEGGDTGPYLLARAAPGIVPDHFKIASGANLSALTFTIGTLTAPAKYVAATAGPNANTVTVETILAATFLGTDEAAEDIYLTWSASPGAVGLLRTKLYASKR